MHFEGRLLDPIALTKLRERLNLQEVAVDDCYASWILESIEDIEAGSPNGCLTGAVTPMKSLDAFFVRYVSYALSQLRAS